MSQKFDLNSQLILAQLHNLYKFKGRYGLYNLVYDFLVSEGHDIGFTPEQKNQIWIAAQNRITTEKPHWITSLTKEQLTAELHKYYKSMLAAEFLLNIEQTTGNRLNITDQDNNKLQLLTFKEYEENQGK